MNSLVIEGKAFRMYFVNTVEPIIIKSLSKLRQNKKKKDFGTVYRVSWFRDKSVLGGWRLRNTNRNKPKILMG